MSNLSTHKAFSVKCIYSVFLLLSNLVFRVMFGNGIAFGLKLFLVHNGAIGLSSGTFKGYIIH